MVEATKARKDGHPQGTKVAKSVVHGRQTIKAKAARATTTKKANPTIKSKRSGVRRGNLPSRALSDFSDADTITVVSKASVFPAGSKAAKRFKLFRTGQTVAECLGVQKAAGFRNRRGAIRKAWKRGDIKIEKAKAQG